MAPNHDLDALLDRCWRELARATADKQHGWRLGALATRDGDGVDARTVVLREVHAEAREILLYTDARSGKARQLAQWPQGTLLLWSPALSWQLRLRVDLALQVDGLAVASRWARLKLTPAAQDYLSPLPPGTPMDGPPGGAASAPVPDRAERAHFAVLSARVRSIDWLELAAGAHRRARFDAQGARWLAP